MVKVVSRWVRAALDVDRRWCLCLCALGAGLCQAGSTVTLVSRLRLDAQLYEFPVIVPDAAVASRRKGGRSARR